ncbi:MAG: hypothetical protein DME18_14930 [Verrucomicrobia bacterium]|nr:MAG: hypothetical protein DME18_14930 [Verrucomicrobiota bacterium]
MAAQANRRLPRIGMDAALRRPVGATRRPYPASFYLRPVPVVFKLSVCGGPFRGRPRAKCEAD